MEVTIVKYFLKVEIFVNWFLGVLSCDIIGRIQKVLRGLRFVLRLGDEC